MICKVNSIFDEIFKIYKQIKSFTYFGKDIFIKKKKKEKKKKSASNNLRKKRNPSLTLVEGEFLAKKVRSYLCHYGKTSKEHSLSENVTGIVYLYQLLIYLCNLKISMEMLLEKLT